MRTYLDVALFYIARRDNHGATRVDAIVGLTYILDKKAFCVGEVAVIIDDWRAVAHPVNDGRRIRLNLATDFEVFAENGVLWLWGVRPRDVNYKLELVIVGFELTAMWS